MLLLAFQKEQEQVEEGIWLSLFATLITYFETELFFDLVFTKLVE